MTTIKLSEELNIPFYFRYYALSELCAYLGISIEEWDEQELKTELKTVSRILLYGIQGGYIKLKQECPYDLNDCINFLSEDISLIQTVLLAFQSDMQAYTTPAINQKKAPIKSRLKVKRKDSK